MKAEYIRKASGILVLASILSVLAAQQHRVNLYKHNEQSANKQLTKYILENADLKMRLKTRLE